MRTGPVTPIVLAAVLAAAGATIGAVVALPTPTPAGLAAGELPRTAAVQHQPFTDERSVDVTFEVEPDRELVVHTGGTLTASACVVGVAVESGQVILRVDERPVVALHTDVPLYRSLRVGDSGTDVRALQAELRELGSDVTVDGEYGAGTARAVKRLMAAAGVVRPDGDLERTDVIWLPERSITPGACPESLGSPLDAGQAVATVPGRLVALRFPVPADLSAGPRTLTVFGVTIEMGDVTGAVMDGTVLAQVAATTGYAVHQQSEEGQPEPTATLALAAPIDALKVPPTSLFAIEGSTACVQQDDRAIPVTVVGSGLGATLLRPVDGHAPPTRVALGDAVTLETCATDSKAAR